jgi:hypothetical protein
MVRNFLDIPKIESSPVNVTQLLDRALFSRSMTRYLPLQKAEKMVGLEPLT